VRAAMADDAQSDRADRQGGDLPFRIGETFLHRLQLGLLDEQRAEDEADRENGCVRLEVFTHPRQMSLLDATTRSMRPNWTPPETGVAARFMIRLSLRMEGG